MITDSRRIVGESIEHLARVARLELAPDRMEIIGPVLKEVYALIDMLDDIPLGETPPATAFDPRWKR
jgi:Asp-tRNA(Asn)/Glu-tRNA(Gln) amidotransferase C subunit